MSCSVVVLSPERMVLAAGVVMVVSAQSLDLVIGNASNVSP